MRLPAEFVRKLALCLEEEETDVYTHLLYTMDSDDLNFFQPEDREKVLRIFKTLIDDTRHHSELLKLIVELAVPR